MREPTQNERWACGTSPELARRVRTTHEIECDCCHERRAITNNHADGYVTFTCAECWPTFHAEAKADTLKKVRAIFAGMADA